LSAQWRGGYLGNMGAFAPSDIGIWGLLFVFGLFGLVVFYAQFAFAWMTKRRQKRLISQELRPDSAFRISVINFIVFSFIESLATGRVGFSGSISFLFIAILYSFNYGARVEKKRASEPELLYG
jgi:hypothetical protein